MKKTQQQKPLILFGVQTDMIFRDFSQSGTFDWISQSMDICFVTTSSELAKKLEPYGPVIGNFKPFRFSNFLWDSSYQAKTLRTWRGSMGLLGKKWFQRKVKTSWDAKAKTAWLVNLLRVSFFYEECVRFLFKSLNFKTMKLTPTRPITLVIVPTIVRDYFADDLIRYANRIRVPSLGLQVNLDAFNIKSSVEEPTHMALWGEQSWYLSRLGAGFKESNISILGTPRYINYKLIKKEEAKKALNLSSQKIYWLFAGSTAAFQEIAVLKKIDEMIITGSLPKNLSVLYKPHPKGQQDKNQPHFSEISFKNIFLFSEIEDEKWTNLNIYPTLFSSLDAVITPYSTMALEAALMGVPLLCVGYHHGEYSQYWEHAKYFFHLRIFQNRKFCIHCDKPSNIEDSLIKLKEMKQDIDVKVDAQQAADFAIFQSETPYNQRLLNLIKSLTPPQEQPPTIKSEAK